MGTYTSVRTFISFSSQVESVSTTASSITNLTQQACLEFPRGLVGFEDSHLFSLRRMPSHYDPLLQLVCLDTDRLSFYALPLNLEAKLIADEDLLQAATIVGCRYEDLAVLVLVSVRELEDERQVTANLRAPIIVSILENKAWQYVFAHARYDVKHVIGKIPL